MLVLRRRVFRRRWNVGEEEEEEEIGWNNGRERESFAPYDPDIRPSIFVRSFCVSCSDEQHLETIYRIRLFSLFLFTPSAISFFSSPPILFIHFRPFTFLFIYIFSFVYLHFSRVTLELRGCYFYARIKGRRNAIDRSLEIYASSWERGRRRIGRIYGFKNDGTRISIRPIGNYLDLNLSRALDIGSVYGQAGRQAGTRTGGIQRGGKASRTCGS